MVNYCSYLVTIYFSLSEKQKNKKKPKKNMKAPAYFILEGRSTSFYFRSWWRPFYAAYWFRVCIKEIKQRKRTPQTSRSDHWRINAYVFTSVIFPLLNMKIGWSCEKLSGVGQVHLNVC